MHPNSAFRPDHDDLAAMFVREIGFAAIFAGTPDGRRAPLFSSCIETNSERIIAAASFERSILEK